MRNIPLRAFAKKSPIKQVEAVAESTSIPKARKITIEPPKKKVFKGVSGGSGIVYDPGKKRLQTMVQANPLATLFTGKKVKS